MVPQETIGLDIDAIRQEVLNNVENTDIEVEEIERKINQSQIEAGADTQKIDWDLENYASNYQLNQSKIKANLDSAVSESIANKADIVLAHLGADLQAEAERMLRPEKGPDIPAPIPLPTPQYIDPMEPAIPPAPIKGALYQSGGIADIATSAVAGINAGVAAAGIAAGSASAGIAAAAGPIGWAVGLGTALFR